MKKLFTVTAVVLIVALLMSGVCFVSAKGGEVATVTVTADSTRVLPGESVHFTVSTTSNYNSLAMRWLILFPSDVFELDGDEGNFSSSYYFDFLGGTMLSNMTGENVPYPEEYSPMDYSAIVVQWTGGGEQVVCFNSTDAVEMFSFDLKVKEDVAPGTKAPVFIPKSWGMFYNLALENKIDPTTLYKASDITYTFTGANITVKSDTLPELLPCKGSDVVIDDNNAWLYGFTESIASESDIDKFLCASNGGEVTIEGTANGFGTESAVKLLDFGGDTVSIYEIVIFGDGTGDGYTDEADLVIIDLINSFAFDVEENSALFKALDLNADGAVDEMDFVIVDLINSFVGEMDQVTGKYVAYDG